MDSSNIINYIKTNYPKVIFKPIALQYKNALGFIVSDNKLVIGFVNNNGNLCKLVEPIDLNKLTDKTISDIIERIPVVSGFTENDKINLLKLFKQKESEIEQISKKEHDKIVEQLKQQLNSASKYKEDFEKYKLMYDSQGNEIIAIKKKYEDAIDKLKTQYDETNKQLQICKNTIVNKQNEISNIIEEYKKEIRDLINDKDTKINDLDEINNKVKQENQELQNKLNKLIETES
jgi:chromosome segregation ATPase